MKYVKRFWNWFCSFFRKTATITKQPVATRIISKGVLIWECELASGDVRKAVVKELEYVDRKGRTRTKREVVMHDGCIYDFAVNGENAVRKFENRILAIAKNKQTSNV
jgi:hypothetical protein